MSLVNKGVTRNRYTVLRSIGIISVLLVIISLAAIPVITILQKSDPYEYKLTAVSKDRKVITSDLEIRKATFTTQDVLAAQNLIPNGNFESITNGQIASWQSSSGTMMVPDSQVKIEGSYSAKLNNTHGTMVSNNWISLEGGKSYTMSLYMRCNSAVPSVWGHIRLGLFNNAFNLVAKLEPDHNVYCDSQWHSFNIPFQPNNNLDVKPTVGFYANAGSTATMFFDDVKLFEQGSEPPVANPTASVNSGNAPLSVSFTANASDPDGNVTDYQWDFDDGTQSSQQNPTHTYTDSGSYNVSLTVWDDTGLSAVYTISQPITVSGITQPNIVITGPTSNSTHAVTQNTASINLSGTIALGGSGGNSISQLTWDNIRTSQSGTVTVPNPLTNGWTVSGIPLNYGLNRIQLTAIDNSGYVKTDVITVDRDLNYPTAANWTATQGSSIGLYNMYELEFDVNTVAENYFFEYDAAPPVGIRPELGVTVRAMINTPSGVVSLPAFYTTQVNRTGSGESAYYTETNIKKWYVRYAPQELGVHSVSLFIEDASGVTNQENVTTFTATSSTNKGFIGISEDDSRYFEFSNGDLFWPAGTGTQTHEDAGQGGANIIRPWMGGYGIYSSRWQRWKNIADLNNDHNEGFSPVFSYDTVYPGSELSQHIYHNGGQRVFMGHEDDLYRARFKPNTQYRVVVRYKTKNIQGPATAGRDYGFVIKDHQWIGFEEDIGYLLRNQNSMIPAAKGYRNWHTVVANYTTGSNPGGFLSLYLDNTTAGEVFVDYFSIKEVLAGGALGGELVRNSKADQHTYVEARPAERIDWEVEQDMYHKYVVFDKNDWIPDHLDSATGRFVPDGDGYYQGLDTKTGWLQQQWWRYLIARWGYSTKVHSWEFNNEGAPNDPAHHIAAQNFAQYMHDNDPHPHLVTTSFWSDWVPDVWNNEDYPDLDYADLHEYTDHSGAVPAGQQSTLERDMAGLQLELTQKVANNPVSKPVMRGESGIGITSNNFQLLQTWMNNPNSTSLFFHNYTWAQLNETAVFDPNYWWSEHLSQFERNEVLVPFMSFVSTLDVHKGGYGSLGAVLDNTNFRVVGQKNLTSDKAHFWIQHKLNTWYNESQNSLPAYEVVNVTITLNSNRQYTVNRWNTYTGEIEETTTMTSNAQGEITISLNITADTAFTIDSTSVVATATPVPSATTAPSHTPLPPTNTPVPTNSPTPTPGSSTINVAEGWLQFNKDAQNTGRSNYSVPPNYRLKWAWLDRNHVSGNGSPGAQSFPLHNNTSPGSGQWDQRITQPLYAEPDLPGNFTFTDIPASVIQPIVAGTRIFFGTTDGDFFAVDALTGLTIWQHKESSMPILSTAAYDTNTDTIVYASMDGNLYGLDPNNGNRRWFYSTGAGIMAHLKVYNGNVYFGSRDGKFYAVNAGSGQLKSGWAPYSTRVPGNPTSPFKNAPIIAPAVISSDGSKVFFAAENMYMYALNTSDGKEVTNWTPRKMVGQSTKFASPFLVTKSDGTEVVMMGTVSSLYGAEEDTTGIETGGSASTFGYGGTNVRTGTGYVTYNPTLTQIRNNIAAHLALETAALRAWLTAQPNQSTINAYSTVDGSFPYQNTIPMGRVTGNNFPPFAGVKSAVGTILYWRGSFATLLADTHAYGTRFCPDISVINPSTGERVVVDLGSAQLGNCPELDNGFTLTSGGNMVYMQNSFRGVRSFNIVSGGTLNFVTHSRAYWDDAEFRGYPTNIVYYGNDSDHDFDPMPDRAHATTEGHSAVVIARVGGKNYLYVIDPDSGAPLVSIANVDD